MKVAWSRLHGVMLDLAAPDLRVVLKPRDHDLRAPCRGLLQPAPTSLGSRLPESGAVRARTSGNSSDGSIGNLSTGADQAHPCQVRARRPRSLLALRWGDRLASRASVRQ